MARARQLGLGRRWLRRLGGATLLLLVLLAVVVGAVLGTSEGTRWATEQALRRYGASIPGRITFDSMQGRAGDEVCVRGLRLADARDRPLVEVEEVCVDVDLGRLPGRELAFEQLVATGVRVHLWPDARWKDLAPQRPQPPPDALPGPDLGLGLGGSADVSDFSLLRHRPGGGETERIVEDAGVRVQLVAAGRHAQATIDEIWGVVAAAELRVTAGSGTISWDSPVVSVQALELVTSRGTVEVVEGELDTRRREYAARVHADTTEVAAGSAPSSGGPSIPAATLDVDGAGTWEGARVRVHGHAPEYGSVWLQATASIDRDLRIEAEGAVEPSAALGLPLTTLRGQAVLARGKRIAQVTASALDTEVRVSLRGEDLRAMATLPGAELEGFARLEPRRLGAVKGKLRVTSTSAATRELQRLLSRDIPRIEASGRLDVRCLHPEDWACEIEGRVRRDADWVALRGEVKAGAVVAVELSRLEGMLRRQRLRLRQPARVTIGGDRITLSRVRLAAAGGTIGAGGQLSRQGSSDLEVQLEHVDLGVIARLVPGTPVRGHLGGQARLTGTAEAPRLVAELRGTGLGWAEHDLGHLNVKARYADRRARVRGRWVHGPARVRLRADLPLDARLDEPRVSLPGSRHAEASVEVAGARLEQLDPWVTLPVAGRVDATLDMKGSLAEPLIEARIAADHLEVHGEPLGHARLVADYLDDHARAELVATAPQLGQVQASVDVPVRIDLAAGRLEHHPRAEHRATAELDRVELAALAPWIPDLEMAGRVAGTIEASSEGDHARVHGSVRGRGLAVEGQAIGAAEVELDLAERASAHVTISGPFVRLVELDADLPLELRGAVQPPAWHGDRSMDADLTLRDVRLSASSRVSPVGVSGLVGGSLHVDGTPSAPKLDGELAFDDLSVRDHAVGTARVRASYADQALVARVVQHRGHARLEAEGKIPLAVDLGAPQVAWARDREHHLRIHAVGVDQELLGSMVELPRDLRVTAAAEVELRGPALEPSGFVRVRSSAQQGDAVPVPVALHAELEPTQQRARLLVGGGPHGLAVHARLDAIVADLLGEEPDLSAVTIEAEAHARDLPLAELAPLLPHALHDPQGSLQLEGRIRGPLLGPTLEGDLRMRGGAITVVPMHQRFTDVDLHATLHDSDIELKTLRARSADGIAHATGSLHLAPEKTRGQVQLVANRVPIVRPGLPTTLLDARFDVELDATGAVSEVEIVAHDGFLDVIDTTRKHAARAIPEDDGVVYTDPAGRRAAAREQRGRTPWIPRDMDVTFRLADPLRVRASTADMDWSGRVTVHREVDEPPTATGALSTDGGRVALLGNDFDIAHGEVRLPAEGDLDPYIDMVATTETGDALVTMKVRGRVSRPTLELSSDPPMPESDIFALLITGHADASEAEGSDYEAKAASVLAAFNNPALQQQLRQKVGIDRVGVGFGDTVDEPIVTVGKRIGRKVYVEAAYHHNAPEDENDAELRLEYRFAPPHWSVETFFGDAAEGGVGLWWQHRFGQHSAEIHEWARGGSVARAPDSE